METRTLEELNKIGKLNRYDVKVGAKFMRGSVYYVCVERPEVNKPKNACKGCGLKDTDYCTYFACSRYDREDMTDVWFVRR